MVMALPTPSTMPMATTLPLGYRRHDISSSSSSNSICGGGEASASGSLCPVVEPLEQYRSKILRAEAYRLKLKIVRKGPDMNDHKMGYIALLREHWRESGMQAPMWAAAPPKSVVAAVAAYALPPPVALMACAPAAVPLQLQTTTAVSCPTSTSSAMAQVTALLNSNDEGSDRSAPGMGESYATDCDSSVSIGTPCCLNVVESDDSGASEASQSHTVSNIERFQSTGSPNSEAEEEQLIASGMVSVHADPIPSNVHPDSNFWENRLTQTKRKMIELQRDIRISLRDRENGDSVDLLTQELEYYTRERKRALRSLLNN